MRWALWLMVGYAVIGAQVGLMDVVRPAGMAPNLVVLMVIRLALTQRPAGALAGGLFLGLGHDLLSATPFGLYGFAYGLVAMGVVSTQHLVYRAHLLAHIAVALEGALIVAGVIFFHELFHPPGAAVREGGVTLPAIRSTPGALILGALLTAAVAGPLLWLFHRLSRSFGRRRR